LRTLVLERLLEVKEFVGVESVAEALEAVLVVEATHPRCLLGPPTLRRDV